jgi:glycosyltransferase involved in cell wall biosynthesis
MPIKLSVIIPAYNEAKNLSSGKLDLVDHYLKSQKYDYEVLIVDDGSTDDTASIIKKQIREKKNFALVENEHGGKAITVMTGLLLAKGEVVLFTDLDQATPLDQIEKFFPKFDEGYDIVIGSRDGRAGAPLLRQVTALGFSVLRNIILGLPFSDTQCGFKAFTYKAVHIVFPEILKRWKTTQVSGAAVNAGFDVEFLFTARKKGSKITDVPVVWHYAESNRVPFLKNAIEATTDMLRIRLSDLQGKYG